ncbi:MAG: hypothetical protein ACYSU5_24080 [Planctomycetota bacterium]|jgi:hypothetical protein
MTKRDDNNPEDIPAKAVQRFVNEQLQGREPDIESFVKEYPGHESQIRQRLRQLHKINNLFSSLTQAEEDLRYKTLKAKKSGTLKLSRSSATAAWEWYIWLKIPISSAA